MRGDDAGLPNTRGAVAASWPPRPSGPPPSERYVTAALGQPTLVGYHWFEHADQPAEGRPDGENSNYGIVTITDEVYADLTAAMTDVNAEGRRPACRGPGQADQSCSVSARNTSGGRNICDGKLLYGNNRRKYS